MNRTIRNTLRNLRFLNGRHSPSLEAALRIADVFQWDAGAVDPDARG